MNVTPQFSDEFQKAIAASRDHAIRLGNNFIGAEHIVLGVISGGDGPAFRRLNELTDTHALSESLESSVRGLVVDVPAPPPNHEIEEGSLILSPEAEAVIHEAMVSSTSEIVSGEHVIATMLKMENNGRHILNGAGITVESFGGRLN